MIGLARRILDAMFLQLKDKLTHEVLVTFMAEVAAIINARPLLPVSMDLTYRVLVFGKEFSWPSGDDVTNCSSHHQKLEREARICRLLKHANIVPIEHRVKATDYLSIVADHVHPFMTTVYPSSDGYFQQDNAPCHKARIISDWFLEHDNEFTVLKWPSQSPDLNPIEHLWDVVEREIRIMDVQPTNLQQLRDAIMSIWTKLSEECFQYLVESVP
ncbi:Transposable element Tcb2 transposase [Merluccius polli]|uniref:Transposable element Tcb2 transposase n=1 Tax=Merluccius polli TaxID=89951 RepID=A0AA47P147_MERPO|nr:Transposable element Tcb2 transposase [Merluccius polli]